MNLTAGEGAPAPPPPNFAVNAVLAGPLWTRMWTRPGGIVDQQVLHSGVADLDAAVKRFLEDR